MEQYEKLYGYRANQGDALQRLSDIIEVLRKECPWDKVQTHKTLTGCMLEEAYEVVDAINEEDRENLREELGDVLLQVVFHSTLSNEDGDFTLSDVINEECEKMIRRHPHVFLKEKIKTIDKTIEKWENIKSKEHGEESFTKSLERVPKAFPALIRSAKVQSKASKAGMDWPDVEGAFLKIEEELGELRQAYDSEVSADISEELGDLLFSVVNASRHLNVDAEQSLNEATLKFVRRFSFIEDAAAKRGIDIWELSPEELDKLWSEAKISCTLFKEDL